MYSWKTTRTVCAVLLLIPLIHLVYLIASETMASLDPSPRAWADEIDAFAQADSKGHLPDDPILVIGGHRVKLWRGLEDLLSPRPVLMRGVGNATVNDIFYNYERLVGFYQPETVVLLPSHSEFHIREYKSAEDMAQAVKQLVELDLSHDVTRRFYVFSPLKTPLYPQDSPKIDKTQHLLQDWAATDERIVILDVNQLLRGKNGPPKPDFYRSDGINLNEHGYLRLSMLLQQQLTSDEIPET